MMPIDHLVRSLTLDFAAKVRWRMKFDHNPLFVTLQDKYRVREFARAKGVQTAVLLYVTDEPETIPFEKLPPRYLIKANHGCWWNILCFDARFYLYGDGKYLVKADGTFLDVDAAAPYELSREDVIAMCGEWLSQRYSEREWAYQQIVPQIVVEELLEQDDNTAIRDYKMFTFQGAVKAIAVRSAAYRRNGENILFDPGWREIPLTIYRRKRPQTLPARPARLEEMIEMAQRLGEGIDFARIDLYDTTQGVVLGEITMYPYGGMPDSPTACPVFNKWLGDQWKLRRRDALIAFFWNLASGEKSFDGHKVEVFA